jgi:glycosyltransferase involved in cell wall biosynthesis
MSPREGRPHMAILPWGHPFEEYLETLDISMERFRTVVSGGWIFNYVRALECAGIASTVILVSRDARRVTFSTHEPTGAGFCVLPAPWWLRIVTGGGNSAERSAAIASAAPSNPRAGGRQEGRGKRGPGEAVRDLARYGATPTLALGRALRQSGSTGILCQEYEYPRFDVSVALGRLLGIPTFGIFQGGVPGKGALQPLVRPTFVRSSAGLIIGVTAEAQRVQGDYNLPAERIGDIQNPVALEEFPAPDQSGARASLGIPPATRVVVWHGRVNLRTKGLDLLVEAWRRLLAERSTQDVRLLLIGSGEDDEALRRSITVELADDSIQWVDRYIAERAKLYGLLAAGDVYVFPSRHEGFPVAPLEAMACGLPLVAGQASGVREILERGELDGGIQVPAEDPEALAAALGSLIDNPERARALGAAARRRVEGHFSVPAVGDRLGGWLDARGFYERTAARA